MKYHLKLYGEKKYHDFFSVFALNFVMQIKMTLGSLRDFRSRGLIGYLITILCNSRTESGQIKGSTFL